MRYRKLGDINQLTHLRSAVETSCNYIDQNHWILRFVNRVKDLLNKVLFNRLVPWRSQVERFLQSCCIKRLRDHIQRQKDVHRFRCQYTSRNDSLQIRLPRTMTYVNFFCCNRHIREESARRTNRLAHTTIDTVIRVRTDTMMDHHTRILLPISL